VEQLYGSTWSKEQKAEEVERLQVGAGMTIYRGG